MADASVAPVVAPAAPNGPDVTGTGNDQQRPSADPPPEIREPVIGAEEVGLQVLEAEVKSLKSAMLEVTAVDETDVPTHDVPSIDEVEDVAKAQLKLLLGIQSAVTLQYKTQQNALKSHMISTRMVETCSQILTYHVKAVEKEVRTLASHIATDVGLGQSSLDQMETTLDKFGTSFNTLGDTLKDMFASQRTSGNKEEELRKSVVREITATKEILSHVRPNTNGHTKELKKLTWEVAELRTGGQSKDSGAVTGQSGSLLAAIGNGFENQIGVLLEGITRCSHAIQEAVEKGVNPEKSLKRKREEEQLQEFQRQKEVLERKRREAETHPVIHPFTGARMMLTSEQRPQLFSDLQSATPDQFAHSMVGIPEVLRIPSLRGDSHLIQVSVRRLLRLHWLHHPFQ